jgi:molecular chaperone HscA
MALFQISEPGQMPAPHQRRYAVGIDLGTTNSLIACVRSGVAQTLPDEQGRHLLPSVVRYRAGAEPVVGHEALAVAHEDPLNTIASVKRLMGRGVADVRRLGQTLPYAFTRSDSAMPRLRTVAGDYSPVEVSAEILRSLKRRAAQTLGAEVADAVITVPAYFDDAQRQATKDAARLAGLNVLRLLNEPTAAAIAYGLDKNPQGVYAVYDLGGGTFDISLLRLNRGVFEVMATGGDSALGGDDMDHAIAEWIMREAGIRDDAGQGQLRRLLRDARAAKEALTQVERTVLRIELEEGRIWEGVLTRAQLNALIDPLIERTLPPCKRVLRDAGIRTTAIDGVVLVGGATRTPRVRETVSRFFGREPLADIDPDRVVAIGAALQADVLIGNKRDAEMLLLDVIPLSLGIEIMGGMVEKIIPRNTTIPVARAQDFTTFKDGQTALLVHVVQGERELVSDCRSLARFELRGIPPMAAGAARIRVSFQIDADGLLSVSARELTTGAESHVVVKPSYGLTDNEIETMLRDSIEHAREDEAARALREQQVEAQRLIEAVVQALAADAALLSPAERVEIDRCLAEVAAARAGTDVARIKRAIQELDRVTQSFAQRRMDANIRRALAGHRLEEFTSSAQKPAP